MVALSVMATQASAITFLSTPGQAFSDGLRFVQFYFGLPLAMVVLCVTAVPIYRRLKVLTAYEYLEQRFDAKTRALAAGLFLVQRGLATGLTIYAPAVVLSVLLDWPVSVTTAGVGLLVVIYTATGGSRAVSVTQLQQMLVILAGMGLALVAILRLLPPGVSVSDAVAVAGASGKLNAVDFSFDLSSRYNFWSGLIGGFFLALSYFGTDQSQVGRYLSGRSIVESRLGLLFNGLAKIPMQFLILFVGVMVYVVFLFVPPPAHFNPVETRRLASGPLSREYAEAEGDHRLAVDARRDAVGRFLAARQTGEPSALRAAREEIDAAGARTDAARERVAALVRRSNPLSDGRDTNYVFLRFVLEHLPTGLVGLILAAVFSAAMSSASAELTALASTTVVDGYKRFVRPDGSDAHFVAVSRRATVFWGLVAVGFAQFASRLGTLVEAVNVLGSLFYGTILGIFLVAFYLNRVAGPAVFAAALVSEGAVLLLFAFTKVSFLWFNVAGCLLVVALSLALQAWKGEAAGRSLEPAA
jgi:Na+/proline symporter